MNNEYITSTGNYPYSHTNIFENSVTYTQYTFGTTNYYSTNNADPASTTPPSSTEITTGYTWTLSDNANGYATVDGSGNVTVTNIPAEHITITLTCACDAKHKSATKTITLGPSAPEFAGYVIMSDESHFLGGTTSYNNIETFNPKNCIWTKDADNYWSNEAGGELGSNNTNLIFVSPFTPIKGQYYLEGIETGTTGQQLYHDFNSTTRYYIYCNIEIPISCWQKGTYLNASQYDVDIVFAVQKLTVAATETTPAISGDSQISTLGTNSSFSVTTNASYVSGYSDYIFYNNTHHYLLTESSDATTTAPTPESRSAEFTYTWSLEGIDPEYATIDAATGVITYLLMPDNDVIATVKMVASSEKKTFAAVSQQVTFKAASTNPTAINSSDVTVYVGNTATVNYTLSPSNTYNYVQAASDDVSKFTVSSSNPHRLGSISVTGVAVGSAHLTLNAMTNPGTSNVTACSTTVNVTVRDVVATPVIEFTPNEGADESTASISCSTEGAVIYYTVNGDEPTTSSNQYSTPFTIEDFNVVKAFAVMPDNGLFDPSGVATKQYGKCVSANPSILIDGNNVTFTSPDDGVTFYYTTNGTDPTTSSNSWTSAADPLTGFDNECTIKVMAVLGTCIPSAVVSRTYILGSNVAGGVVTLNDLEDHNWTYYAGVDVGNYNTQYANKLYSPDPRNVKITYYGNGQVINETTVSNVKVGIDAPEGTFVYYKTLENRNGYKYTTIPNPFSVRPKIGSTYYGFASWKVKNVTGGTIAGKSVGDNINAETEITFVPNDAAGTGYTPNCISMEVELEAVWDEAEVITEGDFSNRYYGVERKFYVIRDGGNNIITNKYKACTYSSFYPNGTTDGTTPATLADRTTCLGDFTAHADSKIEYIYLNDNDNSSKIDANFHNLTIGRGVSNSTADNLCASYVMGVSIPTYVGAYTAFTFESPLNYTIRLESGVYGRFNLLSSDDNRLLTFNETVATKAIFGCDYDRALKNNDNLSVAPNGMVFGYYNVATFNNPNNKNNLTYDYLIKSGKVQKNQPIGQANMNSVIYMGNQISANDDNSVKYIGKRRLIMESGEIAGIAGGINSYGENYQQYLPEDGPAVEIRIKGGTVRGSVYGAAEFAGAAGDRLLVFTRGTINGWVAGGANGTQYTGGLLYGSTFVYIGGNTSVNSNGSTSVINAAVGGNVFASGCGFSGESLSGQIIGEGTTLVVSDNAYIERGAYGGGSFGFTENPSKIYITGGKIGGIAGGVDVEDVDVTANTKTTNYTADVKGGVFGGACQNKGGSSKIYMTGGLVGGGIYGGSNRSGNMSGDVEIHINGGQVGTSSTVNANVHGGGYGSSTRVLGSVNITIGNSDATDSATFYGDVYGGSAEGKTNGNTILTTGKTTNVTLNAGIIHGNLYGGGLGSNTNAADVYGPVQVKMNGGEVNNVFGCNNINGAPQSTVNVLMTGGEVYECVYGGGNQAGYTGDPQVKTTGGTVNQSVYGGGLGAGATVTGNTHVIITGTSHIKQNVYGGGNGGAVKDTNPSTNKGHTHVDIGGVISE